MINIHIANVSAFIENLNVRETKKYVQNYVIY